MIENHKKWQNKKRRAEGYDYSSAGYYFVTFNVHGKYRNQNIFGKIDHGKMKLNEYGNIADQYWREIPAHYENIGIDEYIIMPDHVHGIVNISFVGAERKPVGVEQCSTPTDDLNNHYGKLSKIIKSFKNIVTTEIRKNGFAEFAWQRSYYDHIILDNEAMQNIRKYIRENPHRGCPANCRCQACLTPTIGTIGANESAA